MIAHSWSVPQVRLVYRLPSIFVLQGFRIRKLLLGLINVDVGAGLAKTGTGTGTINPSGAHI